MGRKKGGKNTIKCPECGGTEYIHMGMQYPGQCEVVLRCENKECKHVWGRRI